MRTKYGNRRVRDDGYLFDSIAEHIRYCQLKLLAYAGDVRDLEVHPRYPLLSGFRDSDGVKHLATVYIADFRYVETRTGDVVVEDVKTKPTKTQVFRVKWKWAKAQYPDVKFRLVEG